MSERCETCRYSRVSRSGQWLMCHREPPRHVTTGNYGGHAQWPVVPPESWCGEWREREPEGFGLRKPTFGLGDPQDPSQR